MARRPRPPAEHAIHHVWTRGIDGVALFHDDADRRDFVERLGCSVAEAGVEWLAWALMDTHVHAVVRADERPLSRLMQRVKTGVAVRFNLRAERAGHVFQSRFGSRPVRDDADFLNLLCYVHRNPLTAGLVRDLHALERHPWTSYGALLGRRTPYAFEATEACLARVAASPAEARRRIRDAMARRERQSSEMRCQDVDAAGRPDGGEARLRTWIGRICADLGVSERALLEGARDPRVSHARTRVCRVAVHELGIRPATVARVLGLTRAAVTFALRRQPRRGSF